MIERDDLRKELENKLEKVKNRLKILDIIEEKLLEMKKNAQEVLDNPLFTVEEIEARNEKVKNLEAQVNLLESEATNLS